MRTSTVVMIAFAVLFGLLAVFLAQTWLNNQADQRMKSLEAQRKAAPPARTIVQGHFQATGVRPRFLTDLVAMGIKIPGTYFDPSQAL